MLKFLPKIVDFSAGICYNDKNSEKEAKDVVEITKIKDDLKAVLSQHGLLLSDIIVYAESDLDKNMCHANVKLILTEKTLYVIEGQITVEGKPPKHVKRIFNETDCKEYETERIKNLSISEYISSASLLCEYDGQTTELSLLTKTALRDVRLFVKYAGKYVEKKDTEIDEEDFKNDCFCPKCGNRYPDPVRKICPKCMEKTKIYKRLLQFSKKYKLQMAAVIISLAALSALGVAAPYFSTSFFYDRVLTVGNKWYGQLLFVLMLVVLMRLLSLAVNSISGIISARVTGKVTYDLKKTIFGAIERLSLSFFTARQTGGLMNQINNRPILSSACLTS